MIQIKVDQNNNTNTLKQEVKAEQNELETKLKDLRDKAYEDFSNTLNDTNNKVSKWQMGNKQV